MATLDIPYIHSYNVVLNLQIHHHPLITTVSYHHYTSLCQSSSCFQHRCTSHYATTLSIKNPLCVVDSVEVNTAHKPCLQLRSWSWFAVWTNLKEIATHGSSKTIVCMTAHMCWSQMCRAGRHRCKQVTVKPWHIALCSLEYVLLSVGVENEWGKYPVKVQPAK